mmetsp:Transcript_54683/g.111145  ORF Transcript_54683/g.111145 Transcript_54683/m.111145 type:complete len:250 (+) Transcript_54683:159-908(+)
MHKCNNRIKWWRCAHALAESKLTSHVLWALTLHCCVDLWLGWGQQPNSSQSIAIQPQHRRSASSREALVALLAGAAARRPPGRGWRRLRLVCRVHGDVRFAVGHGIRRLARRRVEKVAEALARAGHVAHALLPHRHFVGRQRRLGPATHALRQIDDLLQLVRILVLLAWLGTQYLLGLVEVTQVRVLDRCIEPQRSVLLLPALAAVRLGHNAHAHELVQSIVDLKVHLHVDAAVDELPTQEALHSLIEV